MSYFPPNVQILEEYEEFRTIRNTSSTPIICLQANFFKAYDNLGDSDIEVLEENEDLFMELARNYPNIDFILVTHGTYCYWTFFDGKFWKNKTNRNRRTGRLTISREFVEKNVRRIGDL